MEIITPFKIGDLCQTVNFQWVYNKCHDGEYRIEINDSFDYEKQTFLLLDYPVVNKISELVLDNLTEEENTNCFGIKVLIKDKIRYLFFEDANLIKHIKKIS